MAVLEASQTYAHPATGRAKRYWLTGILASLLRTTPVHAALCVLFSIVSQIALLAAILLPWNLLIVLSTDALPRLLPTFLRGYAGRELVIILSAGALTAFLLYALCEACISHVCSHGSRSILSRHQKTGLFGSHRQQAATLYRRLLRSVAAAVSCAFIALWLAFFYPLLLLALATYLCGGFFVAKWRENTPPTILEPFQTPELNANAWWGLGFLYAVSWVVADYWRGALPDTTVIFISLLLVRQALILCAQINRTHRLLNNQRNKVGALFLVDVPWQPVAREDSDFQALLEPERRLGWVSELLSRRLGPFDAELALQCRPADSGRIIYVTASGEQENEEKSFLVKLYHASREELAHHEKEILQVAGERWPAPPLLADHMLGRHPCLVFGWSAKTYWMTAEERTSWLPSIRERLLQCELPVELVNRYDRSHPHLAERLEAVDWQFLETLVPRSSMELFSHLHEQWPALKKMLRGMPRQIVIPRLYQHRIGLVGRNPIICNWSRWRWEPIGAGWPRQSTYEQLRNALEGAAATRRIMRQVTAEQAYLAALFYTFEHLVRSKDFVSALKLIGSISEAIRLALLNCPADPDPQILGTSFDHRH